jgi:hypothetical protein
VLALFGYLKVMTPSTIPNDMITPKDYTQAAP